MSTLKKYQVSIPVALTYYGPKPKNASLIAHGYPVYYLTFAYSNGHSNIALVLPAAIPANNTLHSIPPDIGIFFLSVLLSIFANATSYAVN